MPRKPFQTCSESYYHLSARCNNGDWFDQPLEIVWDTMSRYLHFLHFAFGVRIKSFVLMANHFHLIARFPEGNISAAMLYFMRETSKAIAKQDQRINHVYGGRFFRSRITNDHHLSHVYKYVYRNPVEAGVVTRAEDYRFSTLNGVLGRAHLLIPLECDVYLFTYGPWPALHWLNHQPEDSARLCIKRALKHPLFRIAEPRSKRTPHPLETYLY